MADQQIQAGWYPDPTGDVTTLRYWDGEKWTDQTQPAPSQQPQDGLQVPAQPIYAPNQAPVYAAPVEGKDNKGFATAAMVLGIVGIPLVCCAYLAIIPGLLGVIFGILGIKSSRKGMAIAGIICGVIAIAAGIGVTFINIALINDPTQFGLPADFFERYLP